MAQVVPRNGRIDESRRGRSGRLFVELLISARVDHQHALAMQHAARYLENPGRISNRARRHQVEAIAEVERLGARAFDEDVLQSPPANITVARVRSLARCPNTRLRFLAVAVCSKLLT